MTENLENNYEYMSPVFWEMLGYDPSEKKHIAKEWMDLIYDEDKQLAFFNVTKHIETKGKHLYEQCVRYNHKNGHCVWLCKGKVIEWDGDTPLRMIGTHVDISHIMKNINNN